MSNYDLQRLGGVGFQDVVTALAIKTLGAQVRAMGRGKDGGRDMLVNDGVLIWGANQPDEQSEVWEGTTVFQVKHKETLEHRQKDATDFWQAIKHELDRWADPQSGRGDVPDYFVFATNVRLTPVAGSGGFDTVSARIKKFLDDLRDESAEDHLDYPAKDEARRARKARRDRMQRLKKWHIWDGNQIEGMLNAHKDVRQAFNGFLTAGDVLATVSEFSSNVSRSELKPALKDHSVSALISERRVHFDDAGAQSKGVPVEEVVIDLPVLVGDPRTPERVIRYVMARGDRMLKPLLTSFDKPRHLVLTGAPGNGKSTVSKFLTHAYRSAFLSEDVILGDEQQATVEATARALHAMGLNPPASRRWPLNVNLARLAQDQGTDVEYTLLHGIAAILTRGSASKDIPRWLLRDWLTAWPSFIVLDGLDEVTEPSVRKALVAAIEAFVGEAERRDCDILVLVTTRPTGYQDEMPPTMFERIDLTDLSTADALKYGRLVTKVRVPHDEERQNAIIGLLENASKDDGLQRLMRTPLQILIMSIIAEGSRRFSPSRFALFWGFFTTIRQREMDKEYGYSKLIREYSHEILDLHQRVGLLLQQQAETATGLDAVLAPEDLRDVAWRVLNDAGYDPGNSDKPLLDRILAAATNRLVLLVPRSTGGYGFDVRSLQELMAAYALTTGKVEETIPRLRRLGASPHWRNTLLFAAGRYFNEPQAHQKAAVVDLVLTLDDRASHRLGSVFPVGPGLALEIIDDGMVSEPRYLHPLVIHAMKGLEAPPGFGLIQFTRMLMSAAKISAAVRELIAVELRAALGGRSVLRERATDVQWNIMSIGTEIGAPRSVLDLASVKRDPAKSLPTEPTADWQAFWDVIHGYAETETEAGLMSAGETLQAGAQDGVDGLPVFKLMGYLTNDDIAFVVNEAIGFVADACPHLVALLRNDIMPFLWREPIDMSVDRSS